MIAQYPWPRRGHYVERTIPILGVPLKTYNYEFARDTSRSGEALFLLQAEFFPEYVPVYGIDEQGREVEIVYLSENTLA